MLKTLVVFFFVFLTWWFADSLEATARTITTETPVDSPTSAVKKKPHLGQDKISAGYAIAIGEYIKAMHKDAKPLTDTLFIGVLDNIPDVDLPATIQGANVLILDEAEQKELQRRRSSVFLNVISWTDAVSPEYLIVTFKDFKPQHNCTILLKRNATTDGWELDSLDFEYPYGKQNKNH
jgi:hypothetical protein